MQAQIAMQMQMMSQFQQCLQQAAAQQQVSSPPRNALPSGVHQIQASPVIVKPLTVQPVQVVQQQPQVVMQPMMVGTNGQLIPISASQAQQIQAGNQENAYLQKQMMLYHHYLLH